jgi:hypothetical protein
VAGGGGSGGLVFWRSRHFCLTADRVLPGPVVRTIRRDVTQANFTLCHKGAQRDNRDYYTILAMNYCLDGGGFNSRLPTKIEYLGISRTVMYTEEVE